MLRWVLVADVRYETEVNFHMEWLVPSAIIFAALPKCCINFESQLFEAQFQQEASSMAKSLIPQEI